jgi:TorA maturation chaperone TorD
VSTAALDGVGLAALWRLLSLGFTPPTAETVAEVEALADILLELERTAELDELTTALRETTAAELASQYFDLFGGTVRVSPYEGSYELDPVRQGRQMSDVAAFYRAFGANAHGRAAERPDHVGCELEFLAFLELRRLAAIENDEDVELVDEIGASFLTDHAGRWLPTFFAGVADGAAHAAFYRALAVVGGRVIEDELTRRGIEPTSLPKRPSRSSVEGDSFECGSEKQR